MSAQPVEGMEARDPEVILGMLPEREHAQFLREYQAAAEAAAHEVWRWKQLTELLNRWYLIAVAASRPGYYECIDESTVLRPGDGVTLEEIERRRRAS